MKNIWMGVQPNAEGVTNGMPLGAEDGLVSTAWSNPLQTYELHHSQIEQLVGLCAKRFEWEFVIQPQVAPRVPGMGDVALNMGIAAHAAVASLLRGEDAKCIYNEYAKWVLPCITDPAKEGKIYDEYELNVFAAMDWIGNNTTHSKISAEQPFVIPDAAKLSPILSGIDPRWKFAGSMDVIELDDSTGNAHVIDLKFRGRSQYARNKSSSQSAMYGMGALYYGYMPKFTYLEVIKGKVNEQCISLDQGKYDWLFIKARQAIDFIESGNYPISPHDWWCSKRYCKWWEVCRGKYEPDNGVEEDG